MYNRLVQHNRPEWWMTLLEYVVVAGLCASIGFSIYLFRKQARLSMETDALTRRLQIVEARREQAIAQIPILADQERKTAAAKAPVTAPFNGVGITSETQPIGHGDARVVTR